MPDTVTPSAPLRPVDLRTEQQPAPLGLDEPQPLLSWKLTGTGRGRFQTAYRIRVVLDGADPGAESGPAVWDSGDVESAETTGVTYAGTALRPRTRYRWAVRVRDEEGRDSGWSEVAEFETGMLGESDWGARWIGSAHDTELAETPSLDLLGPLRSVERTWLPSADDRPAGDRAHLRTSFRLDDVGAARGVRLIVAGADRVRAWLNGTRLPTEDVVDPGVLVDGPNVLALEAAVSGAPAGLVARLDITGDKGPIHTVVADGTWKASADPEAGWEQPDFDDGAWALAQAYGAHGTPPAGREPRSYRPSPYLRKEFVVDAPVRRARLYATALGLYEVRINGQRVGDHQLTPGWTDYGARVPYQTYDVTELLADGPNAIGAVLADGWYAGNIGWFGTGHYGEQRLFLARLEIEAADGTVTVIGTDGSWRTSAGKTLYADLQNGEVVDARREPAGWDRPGFDASGWEAVVEASPSHGHLEAQVAPPIRVAHELAPVSIGRTPSGAQLIDFGQNLVGWVRLRLRGAAGTHVVMRFAEVLDHRGELYTEALRGARATDEYFLAGTGDETFEPRFTVHGFRYAAVYGYPGEITADDIRALVVYADMERTGSFSCSDARLNKLAENIVWGQRGNFLTVPTDCPQRDERLGWTGDAQVFASTAAFNYDVRTFFRKWLRDLRDGQCDDGAIPHVAPDIISAADKRPAAGAAGWGDAIVIVPHELFVAYGDRRALVENYRAVAEWLAYLERNSTDYIRPDAGFADWLALAPTPRDLVQTAFFAYAAKLAELLAARLGRAEDETHWRQLYVDVRSAYRKAFVRGGGRVVSGSQTAYVLSLQFGLLEPDEEPLAAARLVDEIASRNWHLSTGFLGTPYLLPVLERFGYTDVAYRLLLQDSYPSWLYPVVYGDATTVWERWDSWSDSRGFQDPGMTSFNHYAYGAVGQWMYHAIGGIAPAAPGYERVLVRPRVHGTITSAGCSLETVRGKVATAWRLSDGTFDLDLEVPANARAEVWLPVADPSAVTESGTALEAAEVESSEVVDGSVVVHVGSGTYSFRANRVH